MSEFTWDTKSQRYRIISGVGKGQFVGQQAMEALTRKNIAQIGSDMQTITELLLQKRISVMTWEQATALALKQATIQNYTLGRGGLAQMGQKDYGVLGVQLRSQYTELRGFSQEILEGNLSAAQIRARVQLYYNGTRGALEFGRFESHVKGGWFWERRRRTKTESCSPCLAYSARGWVPIGTLPKPTVACKCRSNCGCRFEFAKKRPTQDWLESSGWVA